MWIELSILLAGALGFGALKMMPAHKMLAKVFGVVGAVVIIGLALSSVNVPFITTFLTSMPILATAAKMGLGATAGAMLATLL